MKWWSDRRKLREDTVLAVLFEHQRACERHGHAGDIVSRTLTIEALCGRTGLHERPVTGALHRLAKAGLVEAIDGFESVNWRFVVPAEPARPQVTRTYRMHCAECGSDWVQVEASNAWEWHEAGCRSGQWLVEARSRQVLTYGYD